MATGSKSLKNLFRIGTAVMLCVICSCQWDWIKDWLKTISCKNNEKIKTFWVLQEKVVDPSMTHSAITHNKPTRLKGAITGVCANNVQPAEWLPKPSTAAEWEHSTTGGGARHGREGRQRCCSATDTHQQHTRSRSQARRGQFQSLTTAPHHGALRGERVGLPVGTR